ncbi:MAG: hypothetical protein K0R82_2237 [Flavipsychrobacter sp.]|jgi:hypothetical protein|nr:hypothetical protein [Flavipsychrobacter sp.]
MLPAQKVLLLFCCTVLMSSAIFAQGHLNKVVTVSANKKTLKSVLQSISQQGKFIFSYNASIIDDDSVVTINANKKPVRQVLDELLGDNIAYKEKDKYIILQRSEAYWYVSGYIYDELTNEGIGYASVYEKQQLVASMTNDKGYFQLKIKDRSQPAVISVSKAWYSDTAIVVKPGQNQSISVKIKPKELQLDSVVVTPDIEKNWLGQFFLSSKQRMQGLNIDQFFVDKPYQASVIPGVSTHGKMSGQVVNKFSFNLLGGYTAGVNGFELAGLFNIVKHDVHYAQVAGVFNIAGGDVDGVQVGGAYNQLLGSMYGVQVGGLSNIVMEEVSGVQVSGLYSHTALSMDGVQISGLASFARDTMDGLQIAGIASVAGKNASGTQIAGLGNISGGEIDGAQIAGLFNYAKKLDGVQIGFINIADTSSGYSIGFLNLVWTGYHKLSLSTNEVLHFNAAFKAGNKRLYSILFGGLNLDGNNKAYSFGYGFGTEAHLSNRFLLNPELTSQYLYLGDWDHLNLLNKLTLNLTFRISKDISIYAGPSANVYYSNLGNAVNESYMHIVPPNGYPARESNNKLLTGWFGWNAGINIF